MPHTNQGRPGKRGDAFARLDHDTFGSILRRLDPASAVRLAVASKSHRANALEAGQAKVQRSIDRVRAVIDCAARDIASAVYFAVAHIRKTGGWDMVQIVPVVAGIEVLAVTRNHKITLDFSVEEMGHVSIMIADLDVQEQHGAYVAALKDYGESWHLGGPAIATMAFLRLAVHRAVELYAQHPVLAW